MDRILGLTQSYRLFFVLCGYPHKLQRCLELKIILSIENDEEPNNIYAKLLPVLCEINICAFMELKFTHLRISSLRNWFFKREDSELDRKNIFPWSQFSVDLVKNSNHILRKN
ncbi:hypothetical protein BGV40_07485 [Methanosarcina sp. Ant1]|nr:hypothetical protein BGV40_07485 [Methanosarcina sp. Ant1]